jgi:capsular exopolysaccharide synthesis family protein
MSHIFDALRRSQMERGTTETGKAAGATELLERAEQETTSTWESAATVRASEREKSSDHSSPADTLRETARTLPDDAGATPKPPQAGELPEDLSGLNSLALAVPPQNRLVALTNKAEPATEAFRLLAVRLRDLRRQRELKKVLITSSTPEEGKSLVAANIALALAAGSREKILIIDGDLRHPTQAHLFGIGEIPGLWEWLSGKSSIRSCIHRLEGPNLWILPSNSIAGNPLDFMQGKRLSTLLEQLTARFDWIVIDSPPAMPLADTSIWAQMADGILIVARTGMSKKKQLQRAVNSLDTNKVIGALLNCPRNAAREDYHYYLHPAEPAGQ